MAKSSCSSLVPSNTDRSARWSTGDGALARTIEGKEGSLSTRYPAERQQSVLTREKRACLLYLPAFLQSRRVPSLWVRERTERALVRRRPVVLPRFRQGDPQTDCVHVLWVRECDRGRGGQARDPSRSTGAPERGEDSLESGA